MKRYCEFSGQACWRYRNWGYLASWALIGAGVAVWAISLIV